MTLTLTAAAVLGGVWWLDSGEKHELHSEAALPTSPSPVFHPANDPVPVEAGNPAPRESDDVLALGIERALVSPDPLERETAFNRLLPDLLRRDPARVTAMVARQEPGDARDSLRTEVARLWIKHDRDAAVAWLETLDGPEQRAGASSAVETLAASAPDQAIHVADQFGVGRDDGYLEHLVQIWATEDLDAAERWIARSRLAPGPTRCARV